MQSEDFTYNIHPWSILIPKAGSPFLNEYVVSIYICYYIVSIKSKGSIWSVKVRRKKIGSHCYSYSNASLDYVCEDKFEFNYQRQKPKILTELMLMLTEQC